MVKISIDTIVFRAQTGVSMLTSVVWGTIAGDIAKQSDLMLEFKNRDDAISDVVGDLLLHETTPYIHTSKPDHDKLASIAPNAQVNIVEGATVGGAIQPIDANKRITLPAYPTTLPPTPHQANHRIGGSDALPKANGTIPGLSDDTFTSAEKTKVANTPANTNIELNNKANRDSSQRMTDPVNAPTVTSLENEFASMPVNSVKSFYIARQNLNPPADQLRQIADSVVLFVILTKRTATQGSAIATANISAVSQAGLTWTAGINNSVVIRWRDIDNNLPVLGASDFAKFFSDTIINDTRSFLISVDNAGMTEAMKNLSGLVDANYLICVFTKSSSTAGRIFAYGLTGRGANVMYAVTSATTISGWSIVDNSVGKVMTQYASYSATGGVPDAPMGANLADAHSRIGNVSYAIGTNIMSNWGAGMPFKNLSRSESVVITMAVRGGTGFTSCNAESLQSSIDYGAKYAQCVLNALFPVSDPPLEPGSFRAIWHEKDIPNVGVLGERKGATSGTSATITTNLLFGDEVKAGDKIHIRFDSAFDRTSATSLRCSIYNAVDGAVLTNFDAQVRINDFPLSTTNRFTVNAGDTRLFEFDGVYWQMKQNAYVYVDESGNVRLGGSMGT